MSYRMMLFFDAVNDKAAGDIGEELANLCDKLIGRPATSVSQIPWILAVGPDFPKTEDPKTDQERLLRWFKTNIEAQGFNIVMVPRPIGEVLQ